ncbi:MAG: tetratricopeptide repeat protein, partial [Candidatus Competibacter sp.]|nr:tetratricopeptide repeat protein [Candidatus Competibacter sp.]
MNAPYHSTFTPSQSDPETLEALFVVREKLAQDIMDGIREGVTGGNQHRWLLIGPRGIGKTHLVALIYHRVRQDADLDHRLRIAWLPEDPHAIADYRKLLKLVLQEVSERYDVVGLSQRLEEVLDLNPEFIERALERLLIECLDGKTLLLITENLDDWLEALKEPGQRKLRAFLQNYPATTILATATSLSAAATERQQTFHGFFDIRRLDPFTVEGAARLLVRLAERAKDRELAEVLLSPMGRARILAVHSLAGGNPRIYKVLYDFLNRKSLDELVGPFMKMIDELTPYYQAHMIRLSPLQRSIIDVLCQLWTAASVKEIARQAMTTSQTISAQLGVLKNLGYVMEFDSTGRSSYYELREPLMRHCLAVKRQRGGLVESFVQFLRHWYSEVDLEKLADSGPRDLEGVCVQEALKRVRSEKDRPTSILKGEFQTYLLAGDYETALREAEAAIQSNPGDKENWIAKARCLKALNHDAEEQLACWQRIAEIDPKDGLAWNQQDLLLGQLGRFQEALVVSAKAMELKPDNPILNYNYAQSLKQLGRTAEAQSYFDKALELRGAPTTASDWDQRGIDLAEMDRWEESLHAYRKALELDPRYIDAWSHLFGSLHKQGRPKLYQNMAEQLVAFLPEEARLWSYFGTANACLGRFEDALAAYERALALDSELNRKEEPAFFYRALMLRDLGRHAAALEALEQPLADDSKNLEFRRAIAHADTLMWLDRWEEGRAELESALTRFGPELWSGRDLYLIGRLVAGTQNPEIWRRFIPVWLKLFVRHERLNQLGQGLVWRIRSLIFPWIGDEVARAWYETWQELAGDIKEMVLPLRLLKASVEYKATRNSRSLIELAQEERRLLEPWLINLFKEEPDEIDREMENLLDAVGRWFVREAEEKRMQAFWQAPVPQIETLDFQRLLENYAESPKSTLWHLLPDDWESLDRARAERLLRLVAAQNDNGIRAFSRERLRVVGVEQRPLKFSQWRLFHIHLIEGDRYGSLDVMASEDKAQILDGQSPTVYAMIEKGAIQLDTAESQSEYTRFFCCVLRGEGERFHLFDRLEELQPFEAFEASAEVTIQPWCHDRDDESGRPIYIGTIPYHGGLFQVVLCLNV